MIFYQHILSRSEWGGTIRIQEDAHWDFHCHKSLELHYVIEGALECTVNGKTEILHEGEFGLCLSNEVHAGRSLGHSRLFICVFAEDCVRSFTSFTDGKEGNGFKFTCSAPVKRYLEELFLHGEDQNFLLKKSCLYAVLNEYLNCVTLKEKERSKPDAMVRILGYVEEHYKSDVRLSDIAAFLNYDYHYTSRLFHSLFKMSFRDFVDMWRVEKAAELLSDKSKKILDVAYESGFQSVRSFNSRFKAYAGICPKEYRKSLT